MKGEVIVGKHRVGVGDLERVRVRFTGVVFCLKDGRRVVHPYPVEDGKILKELLGRGKRESWGEVEGSDAVRSAAPDKGDAEQGNRNRPQG